MYEINIYDILDAIYGTIIILLGIGSGLLVGSAIWPKCEWCNKRFNHHRNCASLKPIINQSVDCD